MAGAAGSELSRGGMATKIEAAKIATGAGTHMVIASGLVDHPLDAIARASDKGGRCTWFLTAANPVTARKKWIAGSLEPKGTFGIDAGAVAALRRGNSLLPVGVVRVLLGDLIEEGLLRILPAQRKPHTDQRLLRMVLDGLQSLL